MVNTGTGCSQETSGPRGLLPERARAELEGARAELLELRAEAEDLRAELHRAREMESRFRQLVDCVPQLVWMADEQGSVDYYNLRAREYAGIVIRADGTWSWSPVLHPEDREPTTRAWHEAARTGRAYSVEHRVRMANGDYRWHLSRAAPREDGGVIRWYGTATDIHALKSAEQKASVAAERYRLVNRATNDLVWHWDLVANRLEWNDAARGHFGTPPGASGPTIDEWAERLHPEDREKVVTSIYEAISGDKQSWSAEYRCRRADGQYRIFLDRGHIARDQHGTATLMIGSMMDVTTIREATEALRDADRKKDELIAMLAHELRNPLAPIRTATELLRAAGAKDELVVHAREVIERQATHMARLIDDLLDASRVARGKIDLQTEPCDLRQVICQTVDDYRASLTSAGLSLVLDVGDDPVWVRGDRTRLAQALGNLLHNAGKFTKRGGRVTVRLALEQGGRQVAISVEDTGIGVSPALLPRLFEPFSQGDQGLDRSTGGLGLGLALVKGLIELHGGTVTAESAGEHRGSVFTLRLATCAERPSQLSESAGKGPEAAKKVLVVEDNHDAADTLRLLLALAGFDVEVAYDGRAGVDAALARPPDVVICDIGLPGGMDGYAVARMLRRHPATSGSVLVALSGYGQPDDRRRSREAGFDIHVTKPVDFDTLTAAMQRPHGGPQGLGEAQSVPRSVSGAR